MIRKSFCLWVGALVAVVLNGCATNIVNLKPFESPEAEIAVLEKAAVGIRAAHQCDVIALAEQTKRMLLLSIPLHKHHQWVYEERKNGRDYGKEMKERTERTIKDDWKFAEEAARLYFLSATLNTALSNEGKLLAKAMVEVADSTDEVNQLALGYTIAGMEWNAGYLKKEKETYFNDLLKKNGALAGKASALAKAFVARIAAQTDSGKVATCPDVSVSPGREAGNLSVLFEGDGGSKSGNEVLKEAILRGAAETSFAMRHRGVTITLKVAAMDEYGAARTAMNIFTFFMVGYSKGGDASLSAFVQEGGGNKIPLTLDAFEINAKNSDTLALLVANRVVGRAHFALLKENMK